jgi:predicted transcriptional regulator
MSVVHGWNEIAGEFSRRNIIPGQELFDKHGNVRLKVSWVITGMLECHKKFMETQYGKLVDEIPISKLRNNISSLMSRVFRSLVLVGLAYKDDTIKTKGAPASCYVLSEEIGKMTLEQFHYVFQGGCKLFKRVADGEFAKPMPKKAPKKSAAAKTNVSDDGKSATINVADGLAIKAININATPKGGVSIEIKFK